MASTDFGAPSHRGAGFLFFLGFALLAAGVGFAFAPHFSWRVQQVAQHANELGLANGVLVVGGLVIFALGIVARAGGSSGSGHSSGSASDELRAELSLLNEQVSNKLGQFRASLLQINEGVASVAAQQQALAQQAQGQEHAAGPDQARDAVFRLAASLDKLHAHFDERIHAVDLQLRSGFETLLNTSYELRRLLDHHVPAAPQAHATVQSHLLTHEHAQPSSEGGIDFYETMQKLDAISGETPQASAQDPQAPLPSGSAGHAGQAFDALLPEEYRDRY